MPHRPRIALGWLVLSVVACGRAQGPAPLTGTGRLAVARLDLRSVGPAPPSEDPLPTLTIEVPEDVSAWQVEAERHWLLERRGRLGVSTRLLCMQPRRKLARLRIPLPPDAPSFNEVRAVVWRQGDVRVSVAPCLEGRVLQRSPTLQPHLSGTRKELGFDLQASISSEPPDSLELTFAAPGHTELAFERLELAFVPWSERLPAPTNAVGPIGPGDMVRLGPESRWATGLTSRRPLAATWDVRAGSRLELDWASSLAFGPLPPDARLVVSAEGRNGVAWEREIPLPARGETEASWSTLQVDASELAARERHELRFELRGTSPREIVCALGRPRILQPVSDPATVVLITSDTHRGDHLGIAPGAAPVSTPFLDALARSGTLFTDCHSSTNVTGPSHVALMTGIDPRRTGVVSNYSRLTLDLATLAEAFADAGWATWSVVSTAHLDDDWSGLGRGFDRMDAPRGGSRDAETTLEVLRAWLAEADGLPLFVWVHLFDAHSPYEVPDEFRQRAWTSGTDPYDPGLARPPERAVPGWIAGVRDVEFVRALYRAEVSYLDDRLAAFFEHPRMRGALVALTADHGENLGDHDVWWRHDGLWPETLHVPLILAGPGVPAGASRDTPVTHLDLGRTLLDLAGLGSTFFPGGNLLTGEPGEGPRFALAVGGTGASLQVDRWLLVLRLRPDQKPGEPDTGPHATTLFRLDEDPGCGHDLARERPEIARELRAELVAWLCEEGAAPIEAVTSGAVDAAMLDGLAELGYAGEASEAALERWFDPDCGCADCELFAGE